MKKVVLSLLLVSLTALLSAELPYQIIKIFPEVSTFYMFHASSLVSISLAVFMYAKIFEDHVTIHPSVHFHPVTSLDDMVEEMRKESDPTDAPSQDTPNPVHKTPKGMTKKGDKLSPEHRAKISASLKKRAEERKAQDARIAKTQAIKTKRKKSGK